MFVLLLGAETVLKKNRPPVQGFKKIKL